VMSVLRSENGTVAAENDTKEGHWVSENSYDIPGGKVNSVKETSVHSGHGWHTQASKQTTVIKQEQDSSTGFSALPSGEYISC